MAISTVTSETLAEFNDARLKPTEEPPEPAKAEKPEAELKPEGEAEPEAKPEEPSAKPKGNHKIESRFQEMSAKVRAAEERATAAEAKAQALEAKATPKPEPSPEAQIIGPEPRPADYADAFEYAKDLAEWSTNKALRERDKQEQEAVQNKAREKVVDGWKARVEAVKLERPDWAELVASSKAEVSDAARDKLIESEFGPQIVGDLAGDDEMTAKVNAMTPAAQLVWIGKMEAKYELAAEKPAEPAEEKPEPVIRERPKAPAPITPVRGTRSADNPVNEPGEYKGTFKEWKAARKRQGAQFA